MTIETRFPYLNKRLPVSVSVLPAETRLALLIPDIENVATRAADEQALRQHNESVIREALQYVPPFAKEIALDLHPTRDLLIENGFRPRRAQEDETETALNEKVAETLEEYNFRPKVTDSAAATDVVRRISKTLHPDVADPVAGQVFSPTERIEVYGEALKVAKAKDAKKAWQLLIETMPRFHLYRIKLMMADGMSFAEIVAQNPELVPELEQLRWVALHSLPEEGVRRRFGKPEEAESEAVRIKRRNEHHGRTAGLAMINGVTGDVFEFAKVRGITPVEAVNQFDNILKFMEDAGGYVGATGEFSYQRGDWVVTPHAATLAKKMEDFIEVLPHGVYHLATVVANPESTPVEIEKALTELSFAVASVRLSAERYGQELVSLVMGREEEEKPARLDGDIISLKHFKEINYQKEYYEKNYYKY